MKGAVASPLEWVVNQIYHRLVTCITPTKGKLNDNVIILPYFTNLRNFNYFILYLARKMRCCVLPVTIRSIGEALSHLLKTGWMPH